MRSKLIVLAVAIIAVSATLGASAFTTGTVSRTATIDVVSDDKGLIALSDGTSGDMVQQTNSGLSIDFAQGDAGGVNPEATYELGNPDDPANQTAFNISNLDSESHDFSIDYTGVDSGATGDTTDNIQFRVFDDTGTEVATVTEESGAQTVESVSSGSTLNVVMVVDTSGLDNSTSLSGTLEVSA